MVMLVTATVCAATTTMLMTAALLLPLLLAVVVSVVVAVVVVAKLKIGSLVDRGRRLRLRRRWWRRRSVAKGRPGRGGRCRAVEE